MSEHGSIRFWSEIGRRNVLRVAAVYVGFSWFVIHSGVVMGEALEAPHWIMRVVSALLIVGFPAVVAFAWVYELTPEGLKRTVEVEKDASLTHRTAQRLDIIIIVLILVLAGLYGGERFLLAHESAEGGAHTAAGGAPKALAGEGISIAVLPFLNLSGDAGQEFFSDGMTEEITSALAKVKDLQVVGRTSAFEFKGQNKDLRAIGKALSASYLLEGSVRKSGNRVRITGQLIRADSGAHIWTENYDRELTDIFATQDDIAKAIAGALQVPLGLNQGEMLVANRAIDPENYQQYLRARSLYRARSINEAAATLNSLIARDPNYAPAWALLGRTYGVGFAVDPIRRSGPIEEARRLGQLSRDKANEAFDQAMRLDPNVVGGYSWSASRQLGQGHWAAAEDLYLKALTSDPNDAEILDYYGRLFSASGRIKAALQMRERLRTLEPFVPIFNVMTADVLLSSGQIEAAIKSLESIHPEGIVAYNRNVYLAHAYAEAGRYSVAADTLLSTPLQTQVARQSIEDAARLLRALAGGTTSAPKALPQLDGELSFVYAYEGAPDRMLDNYERQLDIYSGGGGGGLGALDAQLWSSAYAAVRKSERFKALVRKIGLVDYWRARGWPDACHPLGTDDFECSS